MNRLCSASGTSRPSTAAVNVRIGIRSIVILSMLSAAVAAPARANKQNFAVDNNDPECKVCDQVDGCFVVGATSIAYDLTIPGMLNSVFDGASVVTDGGGCSLGDFLFALTQVGAPTDTAQFRGVFVLPNPTTPNVCPGDIAQCFRDENGPIERLVREGEACLSKIIKDATCTIPPVPTTSSWGLIAMVGLLMIVGTLALRRRAVAH